MVSEKVAGSRFKVGDVVHVVAEPYLDCPFNWVSGMTRMCGKEVTISRVLWDGSLHCYAYRIANTNAFIYCENCFVEAGQDDEIELDESGFADALLAAMSGAPV